MNKTLIACSLFILGVASAHAADMYWDTSTNAGLQGANGGLTTTSWSPDTVGTSRTTRAAGDNAFFQVATAKTMELFTQTTVPAFGNIMVDNTNNITFRSGNNSLFTFTYNGAFTVQGASTFTLNLGKLNQVNSPNATINAGSTFTVLGSTVSVNNTQTVDRVFNFGAVTLGASGANVLRIDNANSGAFAVDITATSLTGGSANSINLGSNSSKLGTFTLTNTDASSFDGLILGSGNITKSGNGTLTLSGANTYSGGTTISNGTLLVNGSISTGTVAVAVAGTLGGTGTVGGVVTVDGAVAPGSGGIGTLTTSNVTWNAGVAWSYDLGDLLAINGSFTKGAGSGWTFDLQNNGGAGVYTLVTWSVSTDFMDGEFAAANVPGGLTPTFAVNANELTLTLAGSGLTAGPVTLYRTSGQPLHVLASVLAANSSDPGGGPVTTVWVSATSSNGHPVYLSGSWAFYVPPANDNTTDYFNFRVANTNGVEAEATATVLMTAATTNAVNVSNVSVAGNVASFTWSGLPGRTNQVEGATELGPMTAANWSNIGQVVLSGMGIGVFAETNPPTPRYYRISDTIP